jgi:hypothetical protein
MNLNEGKNEKEKNERKCNSKEYFDNLPNEKNTTEVEKKNEWSDMNDKKKKPLKESDEERCFTKE